MRLAGSPVLTRLLSFLVAAGIAGLFLIDLCSVFFQCGCRAWWSGGKYHCNIHMPGPHCPWCMHGGTGYYVALAAVIAAQAIVSFWPGRMKTSPRFALALLSSPVVGAAVALIYGWSAGYWA